MPGSGKSEAVKLCSKRAVVVRMGDRVWDEVKKRGLELNEKNVANIANNMREQFGMGIWAKRTIPFIKDSEIIIIDGIRCKEEVKIFKEAFGKELIGASTRAVAAPAGMPADRLKALRNAFKKMANDPEYLARAEKIGLTLAWMDHNQLGSYIKELQSTVEALIDDLK